MVDVLVHLISCIYRCVPFMNKKKKKSNVNQTRVIRSRMIREDECQSIVMNIQFYFLRWHQLENSSRVKKREKKYFYPISFH